MIAARQKDPTLTELLLDAGADPNATDRNGRNAAWHAADAGAGQSIAVLHRFGTDLQESDNNGDTPLHRAALRGYTTVVNALAAVAELGDEANENGLSPRCSSARSVVMCLD